MSLSMNRCVFHVLLAQQVALAIRTASLDFDAEPELHKLMRGEPLSDDMFKMVATQSEHAVEDQACPQFIVDMVGLLDRINASFGEHFAAGTLAIEVAERQNAAVLAVSEAAHRRKCLFTTMQDAQVQAGINEILTNYIDTSLLFDRCHAGGNCLEAYEKIVIWQHGLLALNDTEVFYDELYDTDITKHCPAECHWCTREHSSYYKKSEAFKFKCALVDGSVVPTAHGKVQCGTPTRRMKKFWKKKVWCEVPDWKQRVVRQTRTAALLSCSMHLLETEVQGSGNVLDLAEAHKTCLNIEQGIVVSAAEYQNFKDAFHPNEEDSDNVVAMLTRIIKNLGIQAGLAELIHLSRDGEQDGDHGGDPGVGPHAHGGHAAQDVTSVIEVFSRSGRFSTEGGDVFFVGPLEGPPQSEVCALPPRGGLIGGAFGLLFRTALRFVLFSAGLVISSPVMVITTFALIYQAWKTNWGLGALSVTVGLPVTLALAVLKVGGDVWGAVGTALRLTDFDCDPGQLNPSRAVSAESTALTEDAEPQCLSGMYKGFTGPRKKCVQGLQLTCAEEYDYNLVYEGSC